MILLDHLVGELLHRHRNGQAKRLGGFEVEHEVELGRLQHWQVGRLGTFENGDKLLAAGVEERIGSRRMKPRVLRPRRTRVFVSRQNRSPAPEQALQE
jgi:hypothetical protein